MGAEGMLGKMCSAREIPREGSLREGWEGFCKQLPSYTGAFHKRSARPPGLRNFFLRP